MNGKKVLYVLIALIVGIFIGWFFRNPNQRSNYQYLGGVFRPEQGGARAERNEECLQNPDYRMCMLTDGTSGVCGTSGMCMADFMIDHRKERDDIRHPLCTEPVFKEGCSRFCQCKELQGEDTTGCIEECKSWFYPA
jgi:hypothetical protein